MSCEFLRETSAAYICLISPRGQKWLTQRVPRIPEAGMLHFSDLFFGGSCDNVVHHILTADKQLLKQRLLHTERMHHVPMNLLEYLVCNDRLKCFETLNAMSMT